jgi:hypothetical protein
VLIIAHADRAASGDETDQEEQPNYFLDHLSPFGTATATTKTTDTTHYDGMYLALRA